jgi:hypothetical protein
LQDRFEGDVFGNVAGSSPISVGLRLMEELVSLVVKGTRKKKMKKNQKTLKCHFCICTVGK